MRDWFIQSVADPPSHTDLVLLEERRFRTRRRRRAGWAFTGRPEIAILVDGQLCFDGVPVDGSECRFSQPLSAGWRT